MNRLTACLIARDEEAMIGDCLRSLRGVADHVVVVDTGSSDRTMELAESLGAEVIAFPWADDFAAARNRSIEGVRGGHVLWIDADERLAPGAGAVLRSALRRGRVDLGLLPLHDAQSLDARAEDVLRGRGRRGEPVLLPRLLRRTEDLRWEGIVHEQISGWLTARERRVEVIEAPLIHFGAVPELRRARGKDRRNRDLLERHLDGHPDDSVMRSFLAREMVRDADAAGALIHSERAWSEIVARGDAASKLNVIQPATLRAWLALEAGDCARALEVVETARQLGGDHPNFSLLEGAACERAALECEVPERQRALLERATSALGRCLAAHGRASLQELLPGATHWAAATRLGTVHLLAGRPGLARDAFQRALSTKPDHVEARLGMVEALIDCGSFAAAIQAIEPLVALDSPDAWLLAATAVGHAGQRDDLLLFASQTRNALARKPFAAPHRRMRWHELERALAPAG